MHDRPFSDRLQTTPYQPAAGDAEPVSPRGSESGYAMAVLLVGIAVMMTMMTVALPAWRQQQQREREEELLFRLRQYAHALVLYQRRMPGASPTSIDQLVEQKYLRRKYLDPMTGKDFAVLRVGQVTPGMTTPLPGMVVPQPGSSSGPGSGAGATSGRTQPGGGAAISPSGSRGTFGQGSQGPGSATGGIRGVVSTSKERSIRIWKGRQQYNEWEVTMEDLTPRSFGTVPDQNPNRRPGMPGGSRPGLGAPGGVTPGPGARRSGATPPRR